MSTRRTRSSASRAPTARPQQPTDSPAASLPNETLAQILELSLERMTIWDKQRARINFGKVCYTWYGVALPLRDCVVPDSNRAQDLATMLKQGRLGERAVRSLHIVAEAEGAGRGTKIAKLLPLCPDLTRLSLVIDGFLGAKGRPHLDGPFGKPLTEALKSLQHLAYVEMEGLDLCPPAVLDTFLSSWPHLETLILPNIFIYDPSNSAAFLRPPSLKRLCLSPDGDTESLHRALIQSSHSSLVSLDLGAIRPDFMDTALARLKPIAHQLKTFKMVDGYGYRTGANTSASVEAFIKQLASIRDLTVGMHAIDLKNLFGLLGNLEHLRHFALDADTFSMTEDLQHLKCKWVCDWLGSASSALRTVELPAEISAKDFWPAWVLKQLFRWLEVKRTLE